MHMADSLISPVVGITMCAASLALAGYSSKKVQTELKSSSAKVPLMAILGAFVFSGQMLNFTIPGTGSSGHLGGGLLLAALLGPYAAFIVISSIILVQALFFADGGLLAWGCNAFNMGFFPAFVVYPLLFKVLTKNSFYPRRIFITSMLSAIISLQLGALAVVLQTTLSGITQLPFTYFVVLMQPIHLGIGVVEGFITYSVITFLAKTEPHLFLQTNQSFNLKKVFIPIAVATVLCGIIISWFASTKPDGLEWSIANLTHNAEVDKQANRVHEFFRELQQKIAFLPDYSFSKSEPEISEKSNSVVKESAPADVWPNVNAGTSTSGLLGGVITFLLVFAFAFFIKKPSLKVEQ